MIFSDCQYCGRPDCNESCICELCNNGPGIHKKDCPYDATTEEEREERWEQEPYRSILTQRVKKDNEWLYSEVERLEKLVQLDLKPMMVSQILGSLVAADLNTKKHGEEELVNTAIRLTETVLLKLSK